MKVKVKLLSKCPTLRDPMDCSLPGSSVYGIFQARVLEWVAIAFSDTDVEIKNMDTKGRKKGWNELGDWDLYIYVCVCVCIDIYMYVYYVYRH